MRSSRRRAGIMGGTFDPIHIGHLMLAECAYEQFELEKVLFLPSGNPPHKQERPDGASDRDRLEMVRLAIKDNPHFTLDDEEMYRKGFTYTKDTLQLLRRKHPDTDYYFIIGADSLMSFDSWKEPESICRSCILAAAVRDQLNSSTMHQKMQELKQKYNADVRLLRTPDVDISSSSLRTWCRQNRSIRYYVPDRVMEYITEHGLYQENGSCVCI